MDWRRKHRVSSLHLVGAEARAHTCSLGPGLSGAIFHLYFFPLWQSPSRGVKCKKNTLFLLNNAPVFTSKNYESQRRSWECAREFWRIAKIKEFKKCLICWKSSILTRSLNLVGFEFWDLSRNRKGHVSAVKSSDFCSELGKSFVFKSKCFLLREHFYMCSTSPHTCVCHLFLQSHLAHFPHSSPFFSLLLL
jgi:hypothetical protein